MFSNFSPLTDYDNLTRTLDTYGVAVLQNVFTDEECEKLKQSVFKHLAVHHSVEQPEDYKKLHPISGGILHYYGISLIKEVLDVKTDDRVYEAFKRVWSTDELTMSLDGMNIVPPRNDPVQGHTGWFHCDQGTHRDGMCCVQAFINFEHTEDGDGCLSVLKHSHKLLDDFYRHFQIDTKGADWFGLNKTTHMEWFLSRGCEWSKICAPKGSMVLWDSRTIHTATAPMAERAHMDRWRFIVYVCYTPAHLQTEEDVQKKRHAYTNNQCTAHWPYGVRIFNKGRDDKQVNSIRSLTDKQRKCIGI